MRILVLGPGRSATSWVAETLGRTPGAGYLLEPDGPGQSPFGTKASVGLGQAPVLAADDPGPRALRRLWDVAYGSPVHYYRGQQRVSLWFHSRVSQEDIWVAESLDDPKLTIPLRLSNVFAIPRFFPWKPEHRVVKSVRSYFMVEWLLANWEPSVVICRRHPMDVVASRVAMDFRFAPARVTRTVREVGERRFGVPAPKSSESGSEIGPESKVPGFVWSVGVEMSALDDAIRVHPEFHVIDHEDLCADSVGRFRSLAHALGLEWSAENEAAVVAANRPGTGYERNRVAADVLGAWQRRLSPEEALAAAAILSQFPVAERYDLSLA